MAKLTAGKEVLSYCTQCKLKLAHVIMAMRDSVTIGKVQCKTCKTTQAYKPKAPTLRAKASASRGRRADSELSPTLLWEKQVAKRSDPAKEYSTVKNFSVGDLIQHGVFGLGLVQKHVTNEKIEVLFKSEVKTLVHNK